MCFFLDSAFGLSAATGSVVVCFFVLFFYFRERITVKLISVREGRHNPVGEIGAAHRSKESVRNLVMGSTRQVGSSFVASTVKKTVENPAKIFEQTRACLGSTVKTAVDVLVQERLDKTQYNPVKPSKT